ncbi:tetratricopeptide repeat protein [Maribacter sp. 2307UL18-2]|uniref:tetratricopeptide repeat protein n=1 Tax=Maribacter sp. 2307UL18-2 TaxID=3386274 RepID=UPI0039BCF153
MDVTIAILPFKSFIRVGDHQMFIDGFVEDLTTNLSKFIGLSVISSETIKNLNIHNNQVEGLNTDYLVKGSFREFEDSFRIGIQLIRKKDHAIIFAKDYDFSFEEMFKTQDEILKQLVNMVQQQVDYDILSFSYKAKSTDLKVYESYLLGMNILKKGGAEYDVEARTYFEDAIKKDPNYAKAYTGISLSYFNEWSCQLMDQWDLKKNGAQKYALKALELDENDYVALTVAGRTFLFSREFDKAEHYLRKSLRMNPNDASNLIQVGFCFMFLGYTKEALELYEKALKLNPIHPESYFGYGSNFYFEDGNYTKAIELGNRINIGTSFVDFAAYMAAAHFHIGEFEKMKEYWKIYLHKFSKIVLKTDDIKEEEALKWSIRVNPYKKNTNLKPFWEFIAKQKIDTAELSNSINNVHPKLNLFQKTGSLWEISYAFESKMIQDLKGLHDILTLLQRPEEEIHCSELIGAAVVNEKGMELIDQKAKRGYKRKILHLQEDIAEADALNNYEELAKLQDEYDSILEHLSKSTGLAGKSRKSSVQVDKARSAVTWRIRSSIKKLGEVHPALAKHLTTSIKTGTFCSYRPENPTDWVF